jgi:hypothetical protein
VAATGIEEEEKEDYHDHDHDSVSSFIHQM